LASIAKGLNLSGTRITMTVETEAPPPKQQPQTAFSTPQLIAAMLQGRNNVSDLIFSPGRAPPTPW